MTHSQAIPADINDLKSIAGTLADMLDMAYQAHNECDIDSETECRGEEYGDGHADEHCRLRDAKATVKLLREHRKHEANARLIAASPDLLEALKEWTSMAVNSGLEGCDEILEQAEAAIAKATKELADG